MSMELISVIIPVYNVEDYLEKCVKSVLKQTWGNLEIILVDDGSIDRSGQICDELAKKDKRILVFHQPNGGLSVARNTGLDKSHGSWIAFLDSDDWVEPEMYETLYNLAIEKSTLLSSCLSRDCELGQQNSLQGDKEISVINYREMIHDINFNRIMRFEVWNKLWNRELIGDTRFIPGQVAEDVHFDRILFEKAGRVAHINLPLHNYLVSRPGNTNSSFKIARLCIFDEFRLWKAQLEKENMSNEANDIAAVAANFAIDQYGNAVRTGQQPDVVNRLINEFSFFYKDGIKGSMHIKRKIKLHLFHIHPIVF